MQVAVAQQIYDYVDQRIRRLDKDLKAFDAELTKDRVRQGLLVCSSLLYVMHKMMLQVQAVSLKSGLYLFWCWLYNTSAGVSCTYPLPITLSPPALSLPYLLFCSPTFE